MRFVTWNVSRRVRQLPDQVRYLAAIQPDVVVLQEVTPTTAARLKEALNVVLGLEASAWSLAEAQVPQARKRRLGVLLASRFPIRGLPDTPITAPWSEKAVSRNIESPLGRFEIHGVHVPPGSSNGWAKVEVLESVISAMRAPRDLPLILAGDFNAPRTELANGETITWAQRRRRDGTYTLRSRMRGGPGARWDAAERGVLRGLESYGIVDAFRATHGVQPDECSWILRRGSTVRRRRFDHIFVSDGIEVQAIRYLHDAREEGLSDHSPLEMSFEIAV